VVSGSDGPLENTPSLGRSVGMSGRESGSVLPVAAGSDGRGPALETVPENRSLGGMTATDQRIDHQPVPVRDVSADPHVSQEVPGQGSRDLRGRVDSVGEDVHARLDGHTEVAAPAVGLDGRVSHADVVVASGVGERGDAARGQLPGLSSPVRDVSVGHVVGAAGVHSVGVGGGVADGVLLEGDGGHTLSVPGDLSSPVVSGTQGHPALRLRGGAPDRKSGDVVYDWKTVSAVSFSPRSPELRIIDRALEDWTTGSGRFNGQFTWSRHQINGVLDAIKDWRDSTPPSKSEARVLVVDELEERMRDELDSVDLRSMNWPPRSLTAPGADSPVGIRLNKLSASVSESGTVANARRPLRLSDVLPEEQWWQLYIARRDHATAGAMLTEPDPGKLYDRQASPGFQAAMIKAYRMVLDGNENVTLDWSTYSKLHALVTQGTAGGLEERGARRMGFPLSSHEPAYDTFAETVGGRPLMASEEEYLSAWRAGSPLPLTTVGPINSHVVGVSTRYRSDEIPTLVDRIFDDYRHEVARANNDIGRLTAIARVIRNLHIVHPFVDGNGRLNVYLLLPHLLMREGYYPFPHMPKRTKHDEISAESGSLFNGGYSLRQISTALAYPNKDVWPAAGWGRAQWNSYFASSGFGKRGGLSDERLAEADRIVNEFHRLVSVDKFAVGSGVESELRDSMRRVVADELVVGGLGRAREVARWMSGALSTERRSVVARPGGAGGWPGQDLFDLPAESRVSGSASWEPAEAGPSRLADGGAGDSWPGGLDGAAEGGGLGEWGPLDGVASGIDWFTAVSSDVGMYGGEGHQFTDVFGAGFAEPGAVVGGDPAGGGYGMQGELGVGVGVSGGAGPMDSFGFGPFEGGFTRGSGMDYRSLMGAEQVGLGDGDGDDFRQGGLDDGAGEGGRLGEWGSGIDRSTPSDTEMYEDVEHQSTGGSGDGLEEPDDAAAGPITTKRHLKERRELFDHRVAIAENQMKEFKVEAIGKKQSTLDRYGYLWLDGNQAEDLLRRISNATIDHWIPGHETFYRTARRQHLMITRNDAQHAVRQFRSQQPKSNRAQSDPSNVPRIQALTREAVKTFKSAQGGSNGGKASRLTDDQVKALIREIRKATDGHIPGRDKFVDYAREHRMVVAKKQARRLLAQVNKEPFSSEVEPISDEGGGRADSVAEDSRGASESLRSSLIGAGARAGMREPGGAGPVESLSGAEQAGGGVRVDGGGFGAGFEEPDDMSDDTTPMARHRQFEREKYDRLLAIAEARMKEFRKEVTNDGKGELNQHNWLMLRDKQVKEMLSQIWEATDNNWVPGELALRKAAKKQELAISRIQARDALSEFRSERSNSGPSNVVSAKRKKPEHKFERTLAHRVTLSKKAIDKFKSDSLGSNEGETSKLTNDQAKELLRKIRQATDGYIPSMEIVRSHARSQSMAITDKQYMICRNKLEEEEDLSPDVERDSEPEVEQMFDGYAGQADSVVEGSGVASESLRSSLVGAGAPVGVSVPSNPGPSNSSNVGTLDDELARAAEMADESLLGIDREGYGRLGRLIEDTIIPRSGLALRFSGLDLKLAKRVLMGQFVDLAKMSRGRLSPSEVAEEVVEIARILPAPPMRLSDTDSAVDRTSNGDDGAQRLDWDDEYRRLWVRQAARDAGYPSIIFDDLVPPVPDDHVWGSTEDVRQDARLFFDGTISALTGVRFDL
jgi:hypothetical protein